MIARWPTETPGLGHGSRASPLPEGRGERLAGPSQPHSSGSLLHFQADLPRASRLHPALLVQGTETQRQAGSQRGAPSPDVQRFASRGRVPGMAGPSHFTRLTWRLREDKSLAPSHRSPGSGPRPRLLTPQSVRWSVCGREHSLGLWATGGDGMVRPLKPDSPSTTLPPRGNPSRASCPWRGAQSHPPPRPGLGARSGRRSGKVEGLPGTWGGWAPPLPFGPQCPVQGTFESSLLHEQVLLACPVGGLATLALKSGWSQAELRRLAQQRGAMKSSTKPPPVLSRRPRCPSPDSR